MNACIRAAVRTCLAYNIEPYGIRRGYEGMIENDIQLLNAGSVSNIIQYGGVKRSIYGLLFLGVLFGSYASSMVRAFCAYLRYEIYNNLGKK